MVHVWGKVAEQSAASAMVNEVESVDAGKTLQHPCFVFVIKLEEPLGLLLIWIYYVEEC